MYTCQRFESDRYFNFGYVKYLPPDYSPDKKYPLLFFLHGAGERGDETERAVLHGYMKFHREKGTEYPFIMIAPQCPFDKYWGCYTESVLAFLDYILETLPIDRDRVYLSGISMGGTGTWMLAMAAPDKFAALYPVCGSGIYWNSGIISHIPVLTWHGDQDDIVPISDGINMVSAINRHGGNARIKIAPGVGHDVWDIAYSDEEALSWLLSQRKNKGEKI